MRKKTYLMAFLAVLFVATYGLAAEGHDHPKDKGSMMGHMKKEAVDVVEVGNKICPVSGSKVGGMGPAIKVEHNGKAYNLCCEGCVATFKEDPDKYVKIIEGQMGHPSAKEESHDHSKHVMGEMDSSAMKDMQGKHKSHSMEAAKGEVREVDFEAYQFDFSPETIVVNKGDVVKLHATSRDVPHGIFIKEYGVNTTAKKGEVEEIEFIADKVGEFDILCSVYCGRGHHGMKAKLIVKE